MADDYVLYRESTEEAFTFKDMGDLDDYARNVLHIRGQNDFATRVYMAEMGMPFEFNGEKFIVWDDEFGGYHEYHASTKKSKDVPKFSDMVQKQRDRNVKKERDYKTFVLEEIGELWHHFTLLEGWADPDSEYGKAIAKLHEALANFNREINNMPQFQ